MASTKEMQARAKARNKDTVKGKLSAQDIRYLCEINSNHLSMMFEQEVKNILDLPVVDGKIVVDRPAYNDQVTISEQERDICVQLIAYSTLNQMAAQVMHQSGNLFKLYILGFTDQQINHSQENYGKLLHKASGQVHRILD